MVESEESEGNQMRIKCPNCGSSTQTELVWQDTDNYGTVHTYEYECNCGCAFEVNFIAEKPKILHLPIDKQPKV